MILPSGFRAAGSTAGLKESGKPDTAIIVNDGPSAVAAGVFTTNRVVAHPVTWSRAALEDGQLRAVVLNSGNANAATAGGMAVTRGQAQCLADGLGVDVNDVAVCSTGVIGVPMDLDVARRGIEAGLAALSADGGIDAATAILTTDTVAKTASWDGSCHIAGMAKGAGMIAPGLATMLCVIMTDAVLEPDQAQTMLAEAVEASFNRIDVDGCMSTNDTVLLLASGVGGPVDEEEFSSGLTSVCCDLARAMIGDAEGASHDIHVVVTGASTEQAGLAVARAIGRSNLFKCAIFGGDPNWGRIISAAGTVSAEIAPFDPADLEVSINGVTVCRGGVDAGGRDEVDMSDRCVQVTVDLGAGSASADIWTNDLTHDYVHENSAYTT